MSRPIMEPTVTRKVAGNQWNVNQLQRRFYPTLWRYVGSGVLDPRTNANDPAFENSWANSGGGLQRLRFRDSGFDVPDIEGVVTGGVAPSVVFTIPAVYPLPSSSVLISGTNGVSGVSVWQIDPDGSVWIIGMDTLGS